MEQVKSLESEAGFKVLFECATLGILVVSSSGNIELANPSAEKLFGYSSAELIGQPLEILIPEQLRKRHTKFRNGYFSNPKDRPMGLGIELYAEKKDGNIFPVEISLGYYQLDGEKLAVAFITDISERKKDKESLLQLNETLERRVKARTMELAESLDREMKLNALKSRFVSMASHEFRTPLSTILSSIHLIDQYAKPEQDGNRKKHIEKVKYSVKHLIDILNDFLSLDKLEQGKVEILPLKFNLKQLVDDMINELASIRKTGQLINLEFDGETEIFQDQKILRHIIQNLISNAIKYSQEGEIKLTVTIQDKMVSLKVKDNGIGIPLEQQEFIFTKFFRAKNTTEFQGTGLGLNIAKHYLDLLNGNISFTSKPGEGTTFFIDFPQFYNTK